MEFEKDRCKNKFDWYNEWKVIDI